MKDQYKRFYKYAEKHLKRVPLDLQKEYYDNVLRPAADRAGLPVNTFIKQAIAEKIQRAAASGPDSEGVL